MNRALKVGDRVRVKGKTSVPDYFPGDQGRVLRGPEVDDRGDLGYLLAMDEDGGKRTVFFTADEIEPAG